MIIVLDLDYTLICTKNNLGKFQKIRLLYPKVLATMRNRIYCRSIDNQDNDGGGDVYAFWGVTRPYLEEFLTFCFDYFDYVVVWSAGSYNYVHNMVDYVFRNHQRPHRIFTCDDLDTDHLGNSLKTLTKIFKNDPELQKFVDLNHAIMVDDTVDVLTRNFENSIVIPRFKVSYTIESVCKRDVSLLKIMKWLSNNESSIRKGQIKKLSKKDIFV